MQIDNQSGKHVQKFNVRNSMEPFLLRLVCWKASTLALYLAIVRPYDPSLRYGIISFSYCSCNQREGEKESVIDPNPQFKNETKQVQLGKMSVSASN